MPCRASAYQAALVRLMQRELAAARGLRGINNTVMELRNICNHPLIR